MNHDLRTMICHIFIVFYISSKLANAQAVNQQDPTSSNFQPSLFVVIGILSFMFTLTFLLIIYAKFCYRRPLAIHNMTHAQNIGIFGNSRRFSGLDKTVVESLPYFRFSSLKGAKKGLQCAVCLAEFEDAEILRLLPKCKHGFHIECIDQWLENHSTCPLCRQQVSADDLTMLVGGDKVGESGAEAGSSIFSLFVERESQRYGSSRFSIGGSFRKFLKSNKEEEMSTQFEEDEKTGQGRAFHGINHQIVVSDVMFKNRWSNVSSSDLLFLNSEMLGLMTSDRFSSSNRHSQPLEQGNGHYRMMNVREEMERKLMFEHKVGQIKSADSTKDDDQGISLSPPRTSSLMPTDKRAMSEITGVSRFKDVMSMKMKLGQRLEEPNNHNAHRDVREDIKRRKIWFPIAKRTVQWFADREKNRPQQQQSQEIGQTLDV